MAKKKSQITKKIFKIQDKIAWLNRELNIIEREKLDFVDDFKKKHELEGYHIKYTKGLGGLSDKEYKKMMREPIFHYFRMDDLAEASLRSWFGRGIAHERRNMLKNEV